MQQLSKGALLLSSHFFLRKTKINKKTQSEGTVKIDFRLQDISLKPTNDGHTKIYRVGSYSREYRRGLINGARIVKINKQVVESRSAQFIANKLNNTTLPFTVTVDYQVCLSRPHSHTPTPKTQHAKNSTQRHVVQGLDMVEEEKEEEEGEREDMMIIDIVHITSTQMIGIHHLPNPKDPITLPSMENHQNQR